MRWRVGAFLVVSLVHGAFAHSPMESSTRAIAMEDRLELALTIGMEAGAWLLQGAPPKALEVRSVGPGFALPHEYGARLFEVSAQGDTLHPNRVSVRTDGLEFSLVVEYPRPETGVVSIRAVYLERLPSSLAATFVLTDENGNVAARRVLKPGDPALETKLPGTGADASLTTEVQRPSSAHLVTGNTAQRTESSAPAPSLAASGAIELASRTPSEVRTHRSPNRTHAAIIASSLIALVLAVVWRARRKKRWQSLPVLLTVVIWAIPPSAQAQRQMEKLGRGVVVLHSATAQAYLSWRLLATDPGDIGFNVYRSTAGAPGVKLNLTGRITNTTDFLDTTANFALSNAWYVVPVIGGVEQAPSTPYGLAANSPVRQYLSLPLQPVSGGLSPPYDVKFCWFGDFDGDGEYDYLVDRLTTTATNKANQYLQAYKRDGTFLWQMDMGFNSTNIANAYEPAAAAISVGDKDNVTVYDLDGDGKAEVIVRTANGTAFANGATLTTTNNTVQFLSILDGLNGVEKARALLPNPFIADGPLNCHAGILYLDGIHPSIVFSGENRVGSGPFQRLTVAWDYHNGQLAQRWLYQTPAGHNDSEGHQLRVADVNHDGKDDLVRIGSVVTDSNGVPVTLYSTELQHGDRYHITDIDPDRPGLEMYAIQQNNSTLLATSLQDMGSGVLYKKWYTPGFVDVGRGVTLDLTPNSRGYEMYSTQPGIFDARGNQIYANSIWPPEAIWWDADLLREFEDGAGSGGLNPVINKFNPGTGASERLYTLYNEDGGVHQAYGGRAAVWGDLFGDWREEFMVVANNYAAVRLYTTKIPATNRLYCLMQNPQYRVQGTFKGYYQASYVDYFLGNDMPVPPPPPVSDAQLVWRGGVSSTWDTSAANWFTHNLWLNNHTPTAFAAGATVLFDLSGSNHTAVALRGALAPARVTVHSPRHYTFDSALGQLTGPMTLTKAGAGKLLFNGTNSYTGPTLVGEGAFVLNGSLPNSPVTVRGGPWLDGRLCGTGVVGAAVRIAEGGGLAPGQGTNSPGTLTISNQLTLTGRTWSDFDLSDDPTGTTKTNDLLVVTGNLTLTGTNTLVIRQLNASLPAGSVYPLIQYSGTLSGSLANLAVSGLTGIPYALTNPPGQIALILKSYRAPATIYWTGGSAGNAWDLLNTTNWLNGAAKDRFAPGDTVRFDNVGASNLTVNLIGDLNCAGVVVDSVTNYTLAGSGSLVGAASLTKLNSGTLTISAVKHIFTGRTLLAGGTLIVPELGAVGYPSPLGNPPGGATNLVLSGNSTLRITGESYTDRGLTLNAGTNSLEVLNASDQVTIAGLIAGSGALQKSGPGTLALTVSNNFSGGTVIKAGVIALGGDVANQYAFGSGWVTLDGGAINMFDNSSSYNSAAWNLLVPAGTGGTWNADSRVDLYGTLTGSGTLNFRVPYVRTTLYGNWSAFTGHINVTTDSDGGDFRVSNGHGYANASIHLANLVSAYHTTAGTSVTIGALSGDSGAKLSSAAWTVGAKHTDAIFAGTIAGHSMNKVGTGTWTLTGSNYYTGPTAVSAGTLMVNGNNGSAAGAVSVAAGATLAGTGRIGGPTTLQTGGRLSPGSNAIGTLTFAGHLSGQAGSTNFLEINKAAGTWDLVVVGGTLTCGGTLVVTNLSGTLAAGDSFKLFNAVAFTGVFQAVILPSVPKPLAWNTDLLASRGIISVVSTAPPAIRSVAQVNGALVFGGTGGVANARFYVRGSSNLALPLNLWERVLTNQFDANGNFLFTNPPNPNWPQGFYLLEVP